MWLLWIVGLLSAIIVGAPFALLMLKMRLAYRKSKQNVCSPSVGFFHPYCNAGGGGEKVLWVALQALQIEYPTHTFHIYTVNVEVTPMEILQKVEKHLNVSIDAKRVQFVYLHRRKWIEAGTYPYFTLLGQAIGTMYLALEAVFQLNPDILIDTTGFSFILPVFKYLGGCITGSYVHYPQITKDMLTRVAARQQMYNNRAMIARNPVTTLVKLIYYHIFAAAYRLCGHFSDITMVNSTFTKMHLMQLWPNRDSIYLVYPPCDVDHLRQVKPDETRSDEIRILSLAQFRPEKNHSLQLHVMYELRELLSEAEFKRVKLVLCGSCRGKEDEVRVTDLRDLSKYLSLENNVEFKVNQSYDALLREFSRATIGLHTMIDEHFGISVVEMMAAGLVTVAHESGGPLLDIIERAESSRLGFLAKHAEEYAYVIRYIMQRSESELEAIVDRARASVDRFSVEKFRTEFLRSVQPLFATRE